MTDRERDTIPPPSKDRRWDIDARGVGIADARALAPRIAALRDAAEEPGWVAEEPDAHLWPHIERAITAPGSPWRSAEHSIDLDGRLVVELVLEPVDVDRRRAALQSEVMRLLGTVIEGATYIEVAAWSPDDVLAVDVVTGLLDDQTPFKSHGHTLRFRAWTP
jgi:hypothetical protein